MTSPVLMTLLGIGLILWVASTSMSTIKGNPIGSVSAPDEASEREAEQKYWLDELVEIFLNKFSWRLSAEEKAPITRRFTATDPRVVNAERYTREMCEYLVKLGKIKLDCAEFVDGLSRQVSELYAARRLLQGKGD